MTADPFKIEKAKLTGLDGNVAFTVVSLPQTKYGVHENPNIYYDFYYLRTGVSREDALSMAKAEFEAYGFAAGRFDPEWVSGVYKFGKNSIELELNPDTIKGFNFWVAEGLIGQYFDDNFEKSQFPDIKTAREPTRKLYKNSFVDCHESKESEHDLVSLLTDIEEPSSIMVASRYLERGQAFQASKARCPAKIRVMNYGYIWEQYSTFFEDLDTEAWYQLMNKDTLSKEERTRSIERLKEKIPEPGIVSKINGYTFREADKVGQDKSFLFFDGSLQDMFNILHKAGIKFDDGILV
jgi:hypothetical protein